MRGSTASKIKALDKPAQPCHTPSTPSEEKIEDNRDEQTPSGPVGQAPAGERTSPGLDRRKFICALGATAAAAAFLESEAAEGANQSTNPPTALHRDSSGNIGPADPAALAAGIVPPPVPVVVAVIFISPPTDLPKRR